MSHKLSHQSLAKVYKNACMTELQALKPGNVHVFADGHGMVIEDFIKSAEVTSEIITSPDLRVGERVLFAVEATQKSVGQNTNLGILLLCAPLIQAYIDADEQLSFIQSLEITLARLTTHDADLVARAIVMANPAGLGEVSEHSVYAKTTVTLKAMMAAAQNQDRIAWQYANGFHDVVRVGVDCYRQAMIKWDNAAWATTALYLDFLSKYLDTHVVRKYGEIVACGLKDEANEIAQAYWSMENPKLIQAHLLKWDASLKARKINPGTSADLTVASLLATALIF